MGNEWELIDEKEKLIKRCPCKIGGAIQVDREYIDDYGRYHRTNHVYISCEKCNNEFKLYHDKWIKTEDFIEYNNLENENNKYNEDLYKILYAKYFNKILRIVKTKKALYDISYCNRLFNVPGTLQTFYKNGIDYYISNHSGYKIYDFITLMEVTNCIMEKSDEEKVELSKKRKEVMELFLKSHSV